MASEYDLPAEPAGPQSHPYLHDPLLYISGLPPYVKDEDLAIAFQPCAPFRPNIQRDGSNRMLSGTIEFKYLEKGEIVFFSLNLFLVFLDHPFNFWYNITGIPLE